MKLLRLTGILLLFIIGITSLLSIFLPASQKLTRTVSIHAPASQVYEQLAKLEHFNDWSVWNQQDSSVKHILTGNDGSVGAYTTWKGDPVISGEGKIEIIELEPNRKVGHAIYFLEPREAEATSRFTIEEQQGLTMVTWYFTLKTPRPWNIFNLLHDIDEEMGGDFEAGLKLLKARAERN